MLGFWPLVKGAVAKYEGSPRPEGVEMQKRKSVLSSGSLVEERWLLTLPFGLPLPAA